MHRQIVQADLYFQSRFYNRDGRITIVESRLLESAILESVYTYNRDSTIVILQLWFSKNPTIFILVYQLLFILCLFFSIFFEVEKMLTFSKELSIEKIQQSRFNNRDCWIAVHDCKYKRILQSRIVAIAILLFSMGRIAIVQSRLKV